MAKTWRSGTSSKARSPRYFWHRGKSGFVILFRKWSQFTFLCCFLFTTGAADVLGPNAHLGVTAGLWARNLQLRKGVPERSLRTTPPKPMVEKDSHLFVNSAMTY